MIIIITASGPDQKNAVDIGRNCALIQKDNFIDEFMSNIWISIFRSMSTEKKRLAVFLMCFSSDPNLILSVQVHITY